MVLFFGDLTATRSNNEEFACRCRQETGRRNHRSYTRMKGEIKSEASVSCYLHHADADAVDRVRPRTHADGSADANSRADRYVNPRSDSHA